MKSDGVTRTSSQPCDGNEDFASSPDMSEYFALPGGEIVAKVLDANGAYAAGNLESPTLVFPLQMYFRCPKIPNGCLDFQELRCRVSPFDGAYIATSLPALPQLRLMAGSEIPQHLIHLEIPLDRFRVASLNRMRKGGDVNLRLDFELLVEELIVLGQSQKNPGKKVFGFGDRYRLHTQMQVVISRSKWVEQILPATQFGTIHILELPAIPLESCAEMKKAFHALQHAIKLESQGLYNEAVSQCRIALELFLEPKEKLDEKGEKKKVPQLKSSWETRLGKATYDWLNASLTAVKGPTNKAHHGSFGFDQLETQMLLTVTTSLVAYAVKTRPDNV